MSAPNDGPKGGEKRGREVTEKRKARKQRERWRSEYRKLIHPYRVKFIKFHSPYQSILKFENLVDLRRLF